MPSQQDKDSDMSGQPSLSVPISDPAEDYAGEAQMCLHLIGRKWILRRPASLESLWAAMTPESFGEDERMPYWAELWPASLVLGGWLAQVKDEIAGRVCLDVGCGLGLAAMVGAFLGARVLAFDYEAEAARATRENAALNRISGLCALTADWRWPAFKAGGVTRAWAGDIMYERRFIHPVAAFFERCVALGGVVWLADPCRPVYQEFLAILRARGWSARQVHEERAGFVDENGKILPGVPLGIVRILELQRGGN